MKIFIGVIIDKISVCGALLFAVYQTVLCIFWLFQVKLFIADAHWTLPSICIEICVIKLSLLFKMNAAVKTFCRLDLQKITVASCNMCVKRSVLITDSNIAFVPRKFHLHSCRLHAFGTLCQMTPQGSKFDVPLSVKYTRRCLPRCYGPVAMAVGLLVGWTMLRLHRHAVSCVAEAAETTESHHDNKEQTYQPCHVVSLEEAIYESDQLLERVKVTGNKKPSYRWGTAWRGRASWNLVKFCTNVDDLYLKSSETRLLPIRL